VRGRVKGLKFQTETLPGAERTAPFAMGKSLNPLKIASRLEVACRPRFGELDNGPLSRSAEVVRSVVRMPKIRHCRFLLEFW
jgi:hypothetical protein